MSKAAGDGVPPQVLFTSQSFGLRDHQDGSHLHRRRHSRSAGRDAKRVRLQPPIGEPRSSASSIYMGSYNRSPRRSRVSLGTPGSSAPASPRTSISHSHLESLLQDLDLDIETYGVEELRDGFFDGSFLKPSKVDHEDLMRDAEYALPLAFQKSHPLSVKTFLPKQWHDIKGVIRIVTTTRAGIKLTKSFLAFFISYVLCLVPVIRVWLGRYSYIMVLSTIINHPGRTVGAQIDGAFLTIMGSVAGLGWGAFALWVSDSTAAARRGYGGVLATFLVLFMGTIAALRTYYIRLYQLVLCAGIAISYTCLADTSDTIEWRKLFSYGIPWLFGQALCLLICCTVFPDAGARPLAVSLHDAFTVMQEGLTVPQLQNLRNHRQLAWAFVSLSQAHRDLLLDLSITRFQPSDVTILRNLMQAVIRSFLSVRMECQPFDDLEERFGEDRALKPDHQPESEISPDDSQRDRVNESKAQAKEPPRSKDAVIDIDPSKKRPSLGRHDSEERAVKLIASKLARPTSKLLSSMKESLARCDAVLLDMSSYRKYLGPPDSISTDVVSALTKLRKRMIKYDEEEESLMDNPELPPTYSNHPEVVELFLFVHPIRQAVTPVEALLVKVMEMQQRRRGWRLYLPSYPFAKALQRTNSQVRHDRGGVTAGFYFHSQSLLAKTMKGMTNVYKPLPRQPGTKENPDPKVEVKRTDTIGKYEEEEDVALDRNSQVSKWQRYRYRFWTVLHGLQGFEMRFALKVVIVTSLLSVPAWLSQSRGWWNEDESWWSVVFVWIMMHPR